MDDFPRLRLLPPYIFAEINELKVRARRAGEDVIDFGMANPDGAAPPAVVDTLIEAARDPKNHHYSASRGIGSLRRALADWYRRSYDVYLDPENECLVSIGSKDALGHGLLTFLGPGDIALVPNPCYPLHQYGVVIAGGFTSSVRLRPGVDFFDDLLETWQRTWPRPTALILNFPHNPTGATVDLSFFEKVVAFAREHRVLVIHDFAHAGICFDGYKAPSFLQAPGAREVGIELTSLSKAFQMPGFRVGFAAGHPRMIRALGRMKSLLDYGNFQPVQIAATRALNDAESIIPIVAEKYRCRRDALVAGLNAAGWPVAAPRASMFVWAELPDRFKHLSSLEFTKELLREVGVAVSPGSGFGELGEGHVRFALVEDEARIAVAVERIKRFFAESAAASRP